MTTAEYLRTPETVEPRELAFGVLRVAESPKVVHQRVVRDLTIALSASVKEHELGEVLPAPMDVVLDYDAALVVQPDLLFVSRERNSIVGDRVSGAPDLVVEVLSPNPRIGRLEERIGWFARYGVRECWMVDLRLHQLTVLVLDESGVRERRLTGRAQPIVSDVLAPLRLTPDAIFGY
jgi:Uma2 family endonuclease